MMRWRHPSTLLILAVALFVMSLVVISTDDASALPMHSLHVSLFPEELGAKVTEDQMGAVTFGGNVTIEKQQGVERVTVTLDADTASGWPTVVSPQTMAFINPGTQQFQLNVIVPSGTPVSSTTSTVYVHASSPIWEEDQTAIVRVYVLQYYKLDIWMDQTMYESEPGESVMGRIYVNNSGNGEDTFAISVEKLPKGVRECRFDAEQQTVPHGLYGEFTFTILSDEDLEVGQDGNMLTVVVKVKSLGAKDKGLLLVKSHPFYVYFPGWEQTLRDEWPTYVAYGVAVAVVVVPTFLVIRWRRGRKREEPLDKGIVPE